MKPYRLSRIAAFALLAAAAACESTSPEAELVSDAQITTDVANSSGDAIASAVTTILDNEAMVGLGNTYGDAEAVTTNTLTFDRSRTCYDANGAVVNFCAPLSSVRKIVTHVEIDGSRTHRATEQSDPIWQGVVHRALDDTLTRNFTGDTEISRTHSSVGTGDDTTTFNGERVTRLMSETTRDSLKALTWNLPHSQNPWPASGAIVRAVAVKAVASSDARTVTRELNLLVQVTFPADAQGNVPLQINDKTCNLNLVTRIVSGCQ